MNSDKLLRTELSNYVESPHTHMPFIKAIKDIPEKLINERPENIPYSFWQLLEHIRIAQHDMVDFMQNPDYKELAWPKEYWPSPDSKATMKMWNDSVSSYMKDIKDLKKIIENPKIDLLAPIPHGTGQTILREVLQIIDHNSYHMGQFIIMRRLFKEFEKVNSK
jgi:hypothetical protein